MSSASIPLLHPMAPPMTLVLVAPNRDLLATLGTKLPVGTRVEWEDSRGSSLALDAYRRNGTCIVLLDFRREQAAATTELTRHLQRTLPDLSLVAVGSTAPDQLDGVVAALRAGLRDILDLDASTADIDAVLRRASGSAPVRTVAPEPVHKARLVLVLGVRAGVGSSTLAAHVGVLAQQLGHPAAAAGTDSDPSQHDNSLLLLDLGQPAGDVALYLNLDSQFHYDDALRNANRIDATLARTAMTRHPGGLALLGQPAGSDTGPIADPAVLVQRLRGVFDTVLCDLGGAPVRQIPRSLLNSADDIWLVADQAIGTLVSLDLALKQLEALGVRDGRLRLVINRHDEAGGLAPAQIAERFGVPLLATLPDCHRLRSSANHGHLLLQDAPRDPYLRALTPLLARLDPAVAGALPRGWREKLVLRLSGLPWKTK
ncbi:fimbrial protein [Stenotrophomonas sp.]|uniref:AAA family ATPase n=1 Tax=Stenotrophomonas sp. TaxID=69392 RepID=UPI0028969143|nr:fimbrial protein [Stenotrophomonas sp.]